MGNLLQTVEQSNHAPPADPAAEAQRTALAAGEECRQAAHRYCDIGLSVTILCPPNHAGVGKKHARDCQSPGKRPWHYWKENEEKPFTHEQIDQHFRQNAQSNVGIALGPVSGLVRIDVDGPSGEWKLNELSGSDLPDTWEFESGRENGGRGLLYRIPPGVILKTTPLNGKQAKEELRFQAKGAQTVLPPSRHPSGTRYRWRPGHAPGEIEAALMPAWLIEQMKVKPEGNGSSHKGAVRSGAAPGDADRPDVIRRARAYVAKMPPAISGQGGHNQTYRVACVLILGFALSVDEALPLLQEYSERCQPPWTDSELSHKLADAEKQPGERGRLLQEDTHLTDWGNAIRVCRQHGHDLRHCHPWKQWLAWDGRRWAEDKTGQVNRCVKETIKRLYQETAAKIGQLGDVGDEGKAKLAKLTKTLKHYLASEATKKIEYCISSMRSEPGIPILPDQLDSDSFLFNVSNGTIDLKTGILREHRKEDLITKLAPVEFDPAAQCPRWMKFLLESMAGNVKLVDYLQRVVGYALTGDVSEQVLWFLFGEGSNGKTTFLLTILGMLGDYACQAVEELFMVKSHESHPTERADLFGKRFVACIEVEKGRQIAEALMKKMTGGDPMIARKMKQDFFTWMPTHKIFLAANHKPVVRGTDLAIWRRIKLIPFTNKVTGKAKDKKLPEKLQMEWPGILAWAIRGCLEWQQKGLQEPYEVRRATDGYRREMDLVGEFLASNCVADPKSDIGASDLLFAYQDWSGDRGMSAKRFHDELAARGFTTAKRGHKGTKHWLGLHLLR